MCRIRPVVTVQMARKEIFFGIGVVIILEALEEAGSMKGACARTGISYSKAWRMLKRAEKGAGYELINRKQGGANGGGCMTTEGGRDLIIRYKKAEEMIYSYSLDVFQELFGQND